MLRSKNLKRVLEQALTKDISICAVFNADGVVLAHAARAEAASNSQNDLSSLAAGEGVDAGRSPLVPGAQEHRGYSPEQPPGAYSAERDGARAESAGRGRASALADTPALPPQIHDTHSPYADGSQATDSDSLASSFCEMRSDGLAGSDPREQLDDDLAIVASLWQNYENIPSLIERKDRDVDDYAGDGGSEEQDDGGSNSLHMVIIECENGKAVLAKIGGYRLFMLSKPTAPLGMLKLKSDTLCRFLGDCLHAA